MDVETREEFLALVDWALSGEIALKGINYNAKIVLHDQWRPKSTMKSVYQNKRISACMIGDVCRATRYGVAYHKLVTGLTKADLAANGNDRLVMLILERLLSIKVQSRAACL